MFIAWLYVSRWSQCLPSPWSTCVIQSIMGTPSSHHSPSYQCFIMDLTRFGDLLQYYWNKFFWFWFHIIIRNSYSDQREVRRHLLPSLQYDILFFIQVCPCDENWKLDLIRLMDSYVLWTNTGSLVSVLKGAVCYQHLNYLSYIVFFK